MKLLIAYILILGLLSQKTSIVNTNCYSSCSTCSLQPFNCTVCASNFIFLQNRCLINSQESTIDQIYFPQSIIINSTISTTGISSTSQINCTYTEPNSTALMYFMNVTSFKINKYYTVVPDHDYLNLRVTMAQIAWGPNDNVTIFINDQNISISNQNSTSAAVSCLNATTAVISIQFPLNDTSSTINVTFVSNLSLNAQYAITSYMLRYGGCDPTCEKCFGATINSCLTCKSYLKLNMLSNLCQGCDLGFYQATKACMRCDISCINCAGPGPNNCTSCNTLLYNINGSTCSYINSNMVNYSDLTDIKFTNASNWIISTGSDNLIPVSTCGMYNFLGGYQIGTSNTLMTKVYSIPDLHYQISMAFNLVLIDSTSTSFSYTYSIDSYNSTGVTTTSSRTNECGSSPPESLFAIRIDNVNHNASTMTFNFSAAINISNYFGIRDILISVWKCANGCLQCDPANPQTCVQCYNNYILQKDNTCSNCPTGFYNTGANCSLCSTWCKDCNGPTFDQCLSCNYPLIFTNGQCIQDLNYGVYSEFINQQAPVANPDRSWVIYPNIQTYGNDMCQNYTILGSTSIVYKSLTAYRIFQLPPHTEITLYFNFFQIDTYTNSSVSFNFNGVIVPFTVPTYEDTICGNSSSDSINKIIYTGVHSDRTFKLLINVSEIAKFGINNLIILLKDCGPCRTQLNPTFSYMTYYSYDMNKRGIKLYLDFDHITENATTLQSIMFGTVGNASLAFSNRKLSDFLLNLTVTYIQNDFYEIYSPMNYQVMNQPLELVITAPELITLNEGSQVKPLTIGTFQTNLIRYDYFTDSQTKRILKNLYNFNSGFASSILYLGLISFVIGLSIIFQEFITLMQILFVHIYVCSAVLPPSLKVPLEGLQWLQFLNFLTKDSQTGFENVLFPIGFNQDSPHVFEQYMWDINFIRSIYAIVLMNLMYFIIFFTLRSIFKYIEPVQVQQKNNFYLKYLRNIVHRKFNCIDNFFRYQYFAICWACFLQFTNIYNNSKTFTGVSTFICCLFLAFVIFYPSVLLFYLRREHMHMNIYTFQVLYQDIMYKRFRNQTYDENPYQFYYLIVRFYRLFFIALSMCVGIYLSMPYIALVVPLVLHIIQAIFILMTRLYAQQVYLVFKLIQIVCLVLVQILFLAICASANTMGMSNFMSLGYACEAFMIILILNGAARMICLLYDRIMHFIEQKNKFLLENLGSNPINQAEKQFLRAKAKMNNDSSQVSRLDEDSKISKTMSNFGALRNNKISPYSGTSLNNIMGDSIK